MTLCADGWRMSLCVSIGESELDVPHKFVTQSQSSIIALHLHHALFERDRIPTRGQKPSMLWESNRDVSSKLLFAPRNQ